MIVPELQKAYCDSIKIIARNVASYVYEAESTAYQAVAVELRKLLLDKKSAESFGYHGKTVFEVCVGKPKRVLLHSFDERRTKKGHAFSSTNFRSITPLVYPKKEAIIHAAKNSSHLVTLENWLNESPFFDKSGKQMTVRQILLHIADKEGAHIINQRERDIRPNITFTITRESTHETWSPDVWSDFVVSAGARLLFAKRRKQGRQFDVFPNIMPMQNTAKTTTTINSNNDEEEEILVEMQLDPSTFKQGNQLDELLNSLRVSGLEP